ncbi:RHS repeat domain-containing protein [Pedobacter nototheniae]|uniref:RHS repeat domain-containing protein n=1 Tax=Pedobacter nototheniae TaxID=2488994 RepID=UPI001FE3CA57|nr:RHS repeat-associated core domain-containing protein [Pedobacter nototheniae]
MRATFYKNPNGQLAEVIQRDDYFAFGLRKMGTPNSNVNKYLYNGKELQEELGQYDYGARFYDPVIGRWNVVDPASELDRKTTPYAYAFDDPIRHTDPDGMFGEDVNDDFDQEEGPKPKPKAAVAAAGAATVGGAIWRTLAAVAEGIEIVGTGAATAVAGTIALVFLPQDMGMNGWKPSKPYLPPPIVPSMLKSNEKKGTIYKVPGGATKSGKAYVGRHNKSTPQKTRKSKDGRDRTKAEVIDHYDPNNKEEGQYKEQKAIDENGGVQNLDNKRREVSEERMKEIEKKRKNEQ